MTLINGTLPKCEQKILLAKKNSVRFTLVSTIKNKKRGNIKNKNKNT